MNVTVNFFLRGKENAAPEQRCVIYTVIDVDGKKCSAFSTKLKVPSKFWMTPGNSSERIKPSSDEKPVSNSYAFSEKINSDLIALRKFGHEAQGILEAMDLPVTADAIKELIINPKVSKPSKTFLEVVDEFRQDLVAKGREKSTMLTYRTRRASIALYLEANKLSKLKVAEFRYQHFAKMQTWMLAELNADGTRRWGRNTINKHLTMVRKVLNYAINMEYIKLNPIGSMGLEYDPTKPPCYLDPEARKRIYSCDFKSLERERDVAVFLYSTGLSYTDYESLSQDHLMRLPSGQWFIKKPRDKSEIYSLIPLLSEAHEIITKYGGVKKLPRPDISDLNKALKFLGEASKSPYPLSTSVFRETFSSMMENEYMIPDRLLMFMMGHTNIKQLNNYSAVMPGRILHELNKHEIKIPFNLDSFKELIKVS